MAYRLGDILQPSELRLLRTTFHSCCAIASELLRIHVFLYLRTFLLPRRKRSAGGQTWWLRPARNKWVDMSCTHFFLKLKIAAVEILYMGPKGNYYRKHMAHGHAMSIRYTKTYFPKNGILLRIFLVKPQVSV